jgi:hypothetical protein
MGTATVRAVSGVAGFRQVSLNLPGTYTLRASAAGLTPATSASFLVQRTLVARYCPADVATGASFDSFSDAEASTEPGGTLVICDGTNRLVYNAIDHPLTIAAEHPLAATLTGGTTAPILAVGGMGGKYTVRGLRFVVSEDIAVAVMSNTNDPAMAGFELVVENNHFSMPAMRGRGLVISPAGVPPTRVVVRGNVFTGGAYGVQASKVGAFDVIQNTFVHPEPAEFPFHANMEFSGGGPYVVRNNAVTGCAAVCLSVRGVTSQITDNTFETAATNRTTVGIEIVQGRATVLRNVIRGQRAVGNRLLAESYSFRTAGIQVRGADASVTLEGNSVFGAWAGVGTSLAAPVGKDNTAAHTRYAINPFGVWLEFHRSDFTDYIGALNESDRSSLERAPAGVLSCNYWGTPTGPAVSPVLVPLVTPFSPVPIANKPDVKCPP